MFILGPITFELIKIVILACLYAGLLLFFFRKISSKKPQSLFDTISKRRFRFWIVSVFSITLVLFFFMLSYWGDHGLGDYARIPIGHGRELQEVDGTTAYIQDSKNDVNMISISKFSVTDDNVYGKMDSVNTNYKGNYFLYDLKSNTVSTFQDSGIYKNSL
jgi:hypothetical protein